MGAFYVTTPIYYPNAPPHLGHAYTTIYADILARYHRLRGDEVFFLTGTDEHGLKLQRAAEKRGVHPKEFVDGMVNRYKEYWRILDISYDRFIRTTDEDHEDLVKWALRKLWDKGLIYKAKYSGWYCVDCEKFYSEGEYEIVDGKPYCPSHKRPLEWLEEETYYFKLSEFEDEMIRLLSNDVRVYPRQYALEVLGKIREEGLRDVSIARPRKRVWWGIPLPWDNDYTVYVWFDALLNYLTGAGLLRDSQRFNKLWPVAHHVIGKDILWFHTVIWFSMLSALDIEPPRRVLVHAFLVNKGLKMSKSVGNIVRIEDLVERYQDSDGIRFIISRIFNLNKDIDVSTSLFDSIYNSDLADNYGNLVRRVGTLSIRKLNGKVSGGLDGDMEKLMEDTMDTYENAMAQYEVSRSVEAVMALLRRANAYMNETKPWEKEDPSDDLYTVLESLRVATILLHPIMPKATLRVASSLGFQIDYNSLRDQWREYMVTSAPILFKKIKFSK